MEYRRVFVIETLKDREFMKAHGLNVKQVALKAGVQPKWLNNVKNESRCSVDSDMVDQVFHCLNEIKSNHAH